MAKPSPKPNVTRRNSDKARNERQKAVLLDHVAGEYTKRATQLCAESRSLIENSKVRRASSRRLIDSSPRRRS